MAVNRTCLSAGLVIREILLGDAAVQAQTDKIFPVIVSVDEARLPYITYRRTQLNSEPVKTGRPTDMTYVEVVCYARSYSESIQLAEAVRAALDGTQYESSNLKMRYCRLTDSEEGYDSDAYVQQLVFEIRM